VNQLTYPDTDGGGGDGSGNPSDGNDGDFGLGGK
jgi:hypothetical protein